jgi:RNA polymerase sigma-70 factor (ECF subfamily)
MLQDNIIQEVTPIIFAKALSYMKQREDAEDIVQIVLMKIWADREKIAKEAAVSWALKVTRNDCINELRKKKKIIFG